MSWMVVSHDDGYGMETGMVILVPYFVLGCLSSSLFSGQVPIRSGISRYPRSYPWDMLNR